MRFFRSFQRLHRVTVGKEGLDALPVELVTDRRLVPRPRPDREPVRLERRPGRRSYGTSRRAGKANAVRRSMGPNRVRISYRPFETFLTPALLEHRNARRGQGNSGRLCHRLQRQAVTVGQMANRRIHAICDRSDTECVKR